MNAPDAVSRAVEALKGLALGLVLGSVWGWALVVEPESAPAVTPDPQLTIWLPEIVVEARSTTDPDGCAP